MAYLNKHDPRLLASRIRWYRKNKGRQIKRQLEKRKENAEKLQDLKRGLRCTGCRFSFKEFPCCCDFHHKDGKKEANISQMASYGSSWSQILKEVSKCEPLCANCHRKRHAKHTFVSKAELRFPKPKD